MSSHKTYLPVIASILFLFSAAFLWSNIIRIPTDAGPEYFMDKLFYNGSLVIFFSSAPYLLVAIIKKAIWKTEFKNSIRSNTIGKLEDLITISTYLVSFSILFSKIFNSTISFLMVVICLAVLIFMVYFKPKFLNSPKTEFIQSTRPFKIGDWISLINQNGNNFLVGKVVNFNTRSVQLRSENNTLLILPNNLLTNFVIENYKSMSHQIQFSIQLNLSSQIPIAQAKRILMAATQHALLEQSNSTKYIPDVLIQKVGKDLIEYKINYTTTPWEPASPDKMKDSILSKVLEHLKISGFGLENNSGENNPLKFVEMFASLDKEDLRDILSSAHKFFIQHNSVIIKQGDSGSSMFVLVEGLLDVKINVNTKEEISVAMITPGQFFGEMSLFTGEERSATVISLTDAIVLEIKKESLKDILNKKPELINAFCEVIAERQNINFKMMDDFLNKKESFIQKLTTAIKSFFDLK